MRRLVEYIARFDPEFPRQVAGAGDREIDELERLAGRPLPRDYREFLKHMGRGTDWLAGGSASFHVEDVTIAHKVGRWQMPARFLGVAVDYREPYADIFLDTDAEGGPSVVSMPRPATRAELPTLLEHGIEHLADSLESFFGMEAFHVLQIGSTPWRSDLTQRRVMPLAFHQAEQEADALGMEKLWFSSPRALAYAGDEAALSIVRRPRSLLRIKLAAHTRPALANLEHLFRSKLDLDVDWTPPVEV